jgi:hypothetical protein
MTARAARRRRRRSNPADARGEMPRHLLPAVSPLLRLPGAAAPVKGCGRMLASLQKDSPT